MFKASDHEEFHERNPGRCAGCRVLISHCFCPLIPQLSLRSKLVLIMHRYETFKSTASAPLATKCLTNHEFHIHGYSDKRIDLSSLVEDKSKRTLLLYPGENAKVLTKELLEEDQRPVNIIVPDGSWRQAQRMAKRIPGLGRAEAVVLETGRETEWGLRREPKKGGLATFEAIARAYGVLEGENVQADLEKIFHTMVDTHKKMQGHFFAMKKNARDKKK